ncbi:MAG: hypothetical protein AAF742_01665 [Pseudomonadota bacterium]
MTFLSKTNRWLDQERTHRPLTGFLDDDLFTRAMYTTGIFAIALFVETFPAFIIDTRELDGAPIWLKPQKFNVSMTVHFLTLAVLAQLLPRTIRQGPSLMIAGYLAVGSMVFEQVYISIQAARGRRSHFNYETELEQALYGLMGLGALLLVFVAIVLAVQIWRKGSGVGVGLRTGAVVGLIAGALSTIAYGGYMSMSGSHWIGDHPANGLEVPFFGWSREVGDMRPAHFVTLHMMQTVPFFGWLSDRFGMPSVPIVVGATLIQIALASFLFFQALNGQPFWPAG